MNTVAHGAQNQEVVPENLRKQLAVAMRSIQWSYAILWSLSPSQQGVLEWGDGYYNGDIKTRKTFQTMEVKADKLGLQRSHQLRELYKSLLESESSGEQAKRPTASLSPEDLSDAEWYYLVCMSFVFNPGQGLPGRALANNETIWLSNAQYEDSKVFSRSLLAKSASIQTVACFPYLGGVIELGVTELVSEDLTLIQHIKTSLLDFSKPDCSEKASFDPHDGDDDQDAMLTFVSPENANATIGLENVQNGMDEGAINGMSGEFNGNMDMDSPDDSSFNSDHLHHAEDSFLLEGINGGSSQVQNWHFLEDDFSNGFQNSINSSDCILQVLKNPEKVAFCPKIANGNNLNSLQEGNYTKFSTLDLGTDEEDLHYKRTVSTILGKSNGLAGSLGSRSCGSKSSFMSWRKLAFDDCRPGQQQRILKKILFTVPLMHNPSSRSLQKENDGREFLQKEMNFDSHTRLDLPENQKQNEKFMSLKSLLPCVSQIDKASILNNTIKYVQELEARAEELESCIDLTDFEAKTKNEYADMVEQTSDNYENRIDSSKKTFIHKRKACDVDDETEGSELNGNFPQDGLQTDMKVRIKDQDIWIEMRCAWREYLLLDIMDAINTLHLDAHSVQSSIHDGIFTLSVKSKLRGTAITSAGMIKQALWKVANAS